MDTLELAEKKKKKVKQKYQKQRVRSIVSFKEQ